MKTKEHTKGKSECAKYRLDMVDYATGERTFLTPDKKKRLIQHLKECQACQERFLDYEDIYATAVTEAHFAQPETKKRYAELLGKIKTKPTRASTDPVFNTGRTSSAPASPSSPRIPEIKLLPGENLLDHKEHVGSTAGVVWHYLGKYGKTDLTDLPQKAKLSPLNAYESVGWLAHEKKIYRSYVKQTTYAWLNEYEQEIYQQEQARV